MAEEPREKEKEKAPKAKGLLGTIGGALGSVASKLVPGGEFFPLQELGQAAGGAIQEGLRPDRAKKEAAVLDRLRRTQPPETGAPIDRGQGAQAASAIFAMGPEARAGAAADVSQRAMSEMGTVAARERSDALRRFYADKSQMLRDQARRVDEEIREERRRPKFEDTISALQSPEFEKRIKGIGGMKKGETDSELILADY